MFVLGSHIWHVRVWDREEGNVPGCAGLHLPSSCSAAPLGHPKHILSLCLALKWDRETSLLGAAAMILAVQFKIAKQKSGLWK